jgi:hypothetical protein
MGVLRAPHPPTPEPPARPGTLLGIDLDNTLICYDELFHRAACEEGLIEPPVPPRKEAVRDAIRLLPDGERKWTRLQALVYGPRMSGAALFDGVADFLRRCARTGTTVKIISHKTPLATLDGQAVDLRLAARQWLEAKGFFSDLALSAGDVYFESTRAEKLTRIRALRCTHFIDDLPEVFAELDFPKETRKLLFAPHGASAVAGTRVFAHWRELEQYFFDDVRH